MKLPENKRDRAQVLVLMGIGVIAVLLCLVQFGVKPVLDSRRKLQDEFDKLEEQLTKVRRELSYRRDILREYEEVTNSIARISAQSVLQPILGSYLLGVTETIETAAKDCGIKVSEIQEVGIQEIPGKKKDGTPRVFKSYGVQMTGVAGFERLCSLLHTLEQQNPLMCMTEFQVAGQPDNPERHRISVRIEWPIYVAPPPAANSTAPASPPAQTAASGQSKEEK
jgi:hypothetical protein